MGVGRVVILRCDKCKTELHLTPNWWGILPEGWVELRLRPPQAGRTQYDTEWVLCPACVAEIHRRITADHPDA